VTTAPKALNARGETPRRRRPRAFQQIVDEIRSDVFRRRISPGDRLPNEAALAERFRVSRLAVREALRVLELQGLVRVEHGFRGGAFVSEVASTPVTQALETMLRLEHIDRAEIYMARCYLEPGVAALAARGLDPKTATLLKANLAECAQRLEAGRSAFAKNIEFHRLVAGACGNPILTLMTDAVLELLAVVENRKPSDAAVNREACRAHAAIFAALRAGDSDRAKAAMQVHLQWLQRHYFVAARSSAARAART
jgi:GntR family transcriptional regulator, transcriptional repressor for pyruvate dehydrogenase complex